MFKHRIIFFWLIQSQSQRGACSATLHQRNTYGRLDIIIGQVRFQFDNRLLCYFKHPMISSSKGSYKIADSERPVRKKEFQLFLIEQIKKYRSRSQGWFFVLLSA